MSFMDSVHGKHHLPGVTAPTHTTSGTTINDKPSNTQQVGSGTIAQNGPVPPATQTGAPNGGALATAEYAAILATVVAIAPSISDDAIDLLLAAATMKMKKLEAQSDNDQVTTDTDKKRDAMAVKEEKLKEAVKKIEDAIYKSEHQSIWDKIKCAFEAIGAALMIAIGAILCATGVGVAAGAVMIAAGVVGMVMAIDDIVKMETGLGIAGNLDKLVHPNDPSSWAKADMGFEIGMAVVGIAVAIVGICTGVGALSIIQDAEELSQTAQLIAKTADIVGTAVNVSTSVATATGDIYFGVMNYEAAQDNADAKSLQADAKRMEALMQQLDGLIDMAMQHMKRHMAAWDSVLDAITSAMNDRSQSMQKAKLGI